MDFTAFEAKLKAMGLDLPGRTAEWVSHINSTAVLAALIGGWVVGWIWYALVGNIWKESVSTGKVGEYTPRRQIFGGIAQVLMTIMLGSFMQRLNYDGWGGGIHTAWLLWIGFVMPTILVNYANLGKRLGLTLIDGIHWLLVLITMGIIIGGLNDLGIGAAKPVKPAAASQPAATPPAAPAKTGG
jgi:Protein of unknown function (DUF1761)